MISAIFRHLLSLGVYTLIFVPLLTVFPILSLATPFIICLHPSRYNYLFAEVSFWGGPWGCAFWMIFASPVARSRRLWKKAGYSVHEWREDHGGYLRTLSSSVGWMFFALFFSMFAELVLFFVVWKFDLGGLLFVSVLPFCTFSPMCISWLRGREA
jgi:hypothetical protein